MQADKPRPLPVALTETLRANALAISNPACGPKKYCLLCIEEREERGYGWQYARMKTMEITAERQNPEVFRATSPLVDGLDVQRRASYVHDAQRWWNVASAHGSDSSDLNPHYRQS